MKEKMNKNEMEKRVLMCQLFLGRDIMKMGLLAGVTGFAGLTGLSIMRRLVETGMLFSSLRAHFQFSIFNFQLKRSVLRKD
jgi:hypothetical protein